MDSVLILSNSDSGLFQFRKELIQHLVDLYNVICCVPNKDGFIEKLESIGCRCIQIDFNRRGTNPIQDYQLFNTYVRLIDTIKPCIVLTYTIKPNVYGGMACQKRRIPYIANITGLGTTIENGGILARISLLLYKIGLKHANYVFFQNSKNKRYFEDKRIVAGKTMLIPGSGVNIKDFTLTDYPEQEDMLRFLFVGRLMKDKGIEELFDAFTRMVNEGKKVHLDIVGRCDEDYSSFLSQYENKEKLNYWGTQEDVHRFYSNAHCVVLPSYHEGMSNVMLEAASCGRPVITTNIPGCMETFTEGVTGYGCIPKDSNSLKEAMDKMYETPWSIRKQMGIFGRRKIEKEFDRAIVINKYIEAINSVVINR